MCLVMINYLLCFSFLLLLLEAHGLTAWCSVDVAIAQYFYITICNTYNLLKVSHLSFQKKKPSTFSLFRNPK